MHAEAPGSRRSGTPSASPSSRLEVRGRSPRDGGHSLHTGVVPGRCELGRSRSRLRRGPDGDTTARVQPASWARRSAQRPSQRRSVRPRRRRRQSQRPLTEPVAALGRHLEPVRRPRSTMTRTRRSGTVPWPARVASSMPGRPECRMLRRRSKSRAVPARRLDEGGLWRHLPDEVRNASRDAVARGTHPWVTEISNEVLVFADGRILQKDSWKPLSKSSRRGWHNWGYPCPSDGYRLRKLVRTPWRSRTRSSCTTVVRQLDGTTCSPVMGPGSWSCR
jgi:hypothetical protein